MDLKKYLTISGKPGLFKIISEKQGGFIVESLEGGAKFPTYPNTKVAVLEDISIFSKNDDTPLKDVFKMIYDKESGGKTIDSKSDDNTLKKYFKEVFPEYDEERVYASNIKKVLNWYNTLHDAKVIEFKEEVKENKEPKEEVKEEGIEKEEKPKRKPKKKVDTIKEE